jgi:RNA polymerase sigma-70 factor (sigma-E family)
MRFRGSARPGDSGRSGGRADRDQEFTEYATAAAPRLRDTAYLMCRDWHLADDLVQTALIKLYVAWTKVSQADNVDAYAHKVLLRSFLDHRRRRSTGEIATAYIPDVAGADSPELRLTLLDALSRLKPLDRAIVVLRYWEDYSVEYTAVLLDIGPGVVRTRSMRAMAMLRDLLPEERPATSSGSRP